MEKIMEENKKPYLSKTLWINAILAGVAFFPNLKDLIDPDMAIQIIAGLNILLRFLTKSKIQLK
jgi:hypothetical protein